MRKRIIYCEMEYWNQLYHLVENPCSPFDEEYTSYECAVKMLKAIVRSKELRFDSQVEFDKARRVQPLLRRLVDKSENVEGSLELGCDDYQILPNISRENLNSIFLSEKHVKDALGMGVFVANIKESANNNNLYRDFGHAIEKNEEVTWATLLEEAVHNCNAMIIFDHYLLKKKESNLYQILRTLLPQRLDRDLSFDLSLYTAESVDLYQEYAKISKKLKEIRPTLEVNLSIFICGHNDFHDRAIITNYLWIGAGGGFDLLKKDKYGFHDISDKSTTVPLIYPDLQDSTNWVIKAYDTFISDAKRIKNDNRHLGSGENRLLDLN